jgi:diguanylate cyclase (GGDEF)-like protein
VDADRAARLYVDRGDGVLELVADIGLADTLELLPPGVALARGTSPREADRGRLRRWLSPVQASPSGAVTHLHLPDDRGGLLVLERRRAEPFSEDDLAIARVQARRLVGTVATRLGPRPITWSSHLEAVRSVAAQLTRLTSVEEVTSALCAHTQRVVSFDNARVYVLRDDGRTLDPVAWQSQVSEYQGETVEGLRVTVGQGITGWVALTGQPLNVPDADSDPRAVDVPGSLDLLEESMLLAPLRSEGRVIGVVVLSRLGLARFSNDELRLLCVLADLAAVAIENARLLAERDRHVSELEALLDISQAGGETKDEADLAGVLSERLCHAAGMDTCLIWRWDQQSGDLVAIGAAGRSLEELPRDLAIDRLARHVLITDEPLRLDGRSGRLDPAGQARLAELGGGSALLVPLSAGGRVVGMAELASRSDGRHFHAGEMAWLRTMANQAAGALENASLVRQLRDAAETDTVTGVYSHRHLQDRIRQETARAARSGSPLSVLMVDLDDFKRVNDDYGHQAGDRVLRAIAGALRAAVRTSDVVARYGGDEFVVLMPDTDGAEAAHVAQRAAEAVAAKAHPMTDGTEVHVTCSAGLALYPRDGNSARRLLRSADAAMYTHKRTRSSAGRATVTVHGTPMEREAPGASVR